MSPSKSELNFAFKKEVSSPSPFGNWDFWLVFAFGKWKFPVSLPIICTSICSCNTGNFITKIVNELFQVHSQHNRISISMIKPMNKIAQKWRCPKLNNIVLFHWEFPHDGSATVLYLFSVNEMNRNCVCLLRKSKFIGKQLIMDCFVFLQTVPSRILLYFSPPFSPPSNDETKTDCFRSEAFCEYNSLSLNYL